ncbi:probable WRKY transcription factor 41 [Cicer arietinum]|uniref:Probable WRKY transcription factor 41 n=1 Tax=Cicer arietinum TaxID=3827 RepID=B4XKD2_CICAR|nr:probable WRKY transcription factor 41 [Cicer arietinum]ABX10954.1 WRKY family transcription factor [Cicer arietinum]
MQYKMENECSWEYNTLINELIQGMDVAKRLKEELRTPYSLNTRDSQVKIILSSYEKALQILKCNEPTSKTQTMSRAKTLLPESPVSANGSLLSEDIDGAIQDHQEVKHNSKKRKVTPKWMDQIRVSCESGLEGPHEDGYNWRKYGQKDILGAKYPRSYYRCTFRNTQNCWATKQVQRSDEDPNMFDITYRGRHTCSQGNNVTEPRKSQDKQEKPQSQNNDIHHAQPSQENFTKFSNTLTVKTDNLGNEEMTCPFTFPSTSFGYTTQENHSWVPPALENDSFLSSLFQSHLLSPATPESNYFSSPTFHMNEFDRVYNKPCSESDITEIISTNTSVTNSPIPDFHFSLDPVEISLSIILAFSPNRT